MSKQIKHFYEFGNFRLDPMERQLRRDEAVVPLSPKAFEMLVVLVRNGGHLLSKEELMRAVWVDTVVEDNNLDKTISALRKTLGENSATGKYIETVRGRGYRFAPQVREVCDAETFEPQGAALNGATAGGRKVEEATIDATPPASTPTVERETLAEASEASVALAGATPPPTEMAWRVPGKASVVVIAASLLVILTLSFLYVRSLREDKRSETKPEMTFARLTNGGDVRNATLSPDGKYFVYEEQDGGVSHLWLRQTEQSNPLQIIPPEERALIGTTFSPDGQFIYYTAFNQYDTNGALYRVPTLGGVQTKLLTRINSPVTVSPDGKQLAFVRLGVEAGETQLIIAAFDGSGERILLTHKGREFIAASGASWSPDGRTIACGLMSSATPSSDLFCRLVGVDVQSGVERLLSEQKWDACGRMAWTGDGQGLVVIGTKQGESDSVRRDQVWYVTYPAGEVHRITTDLSRHFWNSLGVTSDSNALLVIPFNRTSQIWSMKANGDARSAVQLTNGTSDGRAGIAELTDNRIVYVSRTGDHVDLWQMSAGGSGQKQLTNDPPFLEEVRVTPDGRYLIFASDRNGRSHLFRVDADGANMKQVTSGDSYEIDSDCSPDSQWVIYTSKPVSSNGYRDERLWKVSIDGGTPIRLTDTYALSPHVSPDGKLVSYVYIENSDLKIAVISANGGEPIKTFAPVKVPELNIGCRFTPDSQALTYIVTKKNISNLWLQPLNGKAPRPLTDFKDGEIYNYVFSRDGTRLFLARGHQIHDALLIKNFK